VYDRTVKGMSSHFVWVNRSKESLSLDLKRPQAKAILARLLEKADVFLHNLAPGAVDRLGLGASELQIFLLVVIPSAAPYIVTGMRIAMASSFMSIIPAEILAADSGIGFLLQQSSGLLQTNRIFVALLTICVLGFVTDRLFRIAVDRMLSRYMSYISLT